MGIFRSTVKLKSKVNKPRAIDHRWSSTSRQWKRRQAFDQMFIEIRNNYDLPRRVARAIARDKAKRLLAGSVA